MRKFAKCTLFWAVISAPLVFWMGDTASAHKIDYDIIETTLSTGGGEKTLSLNIDTVSPIALSDNYQDDAKLPPAVIEKYYATLFDEGIDVSTTSGRCKFTLNSRKITNIHTNLQGKFNCIDTIDNIDDITIKSTLFHDHLTRYDNFTNVTIGDKKWELLFTHDKTKFPGDVTAARTFKDSVIAIINEFFKLGVEHIWKGYDHLLFLLTAILLLRKLKDFLIVVTSFTVAHSITISLAALNILTLPPKIIEPIIVFTIFCVALRNLYILKNKEKIINISERWAMTFGFGLIHGLGFAGALKEIGIPERYFAAAIGSFNVGIEAGQLAVLLLMVPILILLYRTNRRRLILIIVTLITAVAAAVLTMQRILAG